MKIIKALAVAIDVWKSKLSVDNKDGLIYFSNVGNVVQLEYLIEMI